MFFRAVSYYTTMYFVYLHFLYVLHNFEIIIRKQISILTIKYCLDPIIIPAFFHAKIAVNHEVTGLTAILNR